MLAEAVAAAFLAAVLPAGASAQPWSLARVLEAVRHHDPGVAAARAEGRAGRAAAASRWLSFSPRVSFEAGATRSDDPALLFSQKLWQGRFGSADFDPLLLNQPPASTAYQWGLRVEQPVWNGGNEFLGPMAAARRGRAASARAEAAIANRLLDAVETYVGALRTRDAEAAESLATAAAAEHRRAAVERFGHGLVSELDTLVAAARWAEAYARRLDRRVERGVAFERLSQMVGEPVSPASIMAESAPPAIPERAGRVPGLRSAEESAAALRLEARRAGFSLLPSINAQYTVFDYRGSDPLSSERRWTAAAMLSLPLWDGLQRFQAWRSANAGAEAAAARVEELRQRTVLALADARGRLGVAEERREAAHIGRHAAEEALRLAGERYHAGLLSFSDLLAADSDASRARLRAVEAESAALLAGYQLLHAMGELK